MSKASSPEDIERLLEPVVARAGLDLESINLTPAGRRRLLRVVVDQDGGVSLDDIASLSQAVSGVLDRSDAMGSVPYLLEVTSPGVDRPLTAVRHWRRATGRLVKVRRADGDEVLGRVVSASDEAVVLDCDGAARSLHWAEVGPGHVQVEFRRPADERDDEDKEV